MLFWVGIVRHSLSANQIVRCFKLKKLKKDLRYQVDFLLPLELEEILCYFGLLPPKYCWPISLQDILLLACFGLLNLIPGSIATLYLFPNYFWRKMFVMLYPTNWLNFIVWLLLLLEILGNMSILIICCLVCDTINFEKKLNFFIIPFYYMFKKLGQKCKYLKTEKRF